MTVTTLDGVLYSLISAAPAVRNLVGSSCFAGILPVNCTFPAVSIFLISSPYSRVVEAPRFQVSAWSDNLLTAKTLSKTIERVLDGYSGIVDGFEIVRIVPLEAVDIPRDDSTGLYQVAYDFQIICKK